MSWFEQTHRRAWVIAACLCAISSHSARAQSIRGSEYAPLMGMNNGAKNYDDPNYQDALAKLNVVILGLFPGWKGDRDGSVFRPLVQSLKSRNPGLLVGQYTILNEAHDRQVKTSETDKTDKLDQENWWLRDGSGKKIQWTSQYGAWDVNFTDFAKPDKNGDRYPQWLAKRDFNLYFKPVPEFDIWFFDNIFVQAASARADWRQAGNDESSKSADLAAAFRRGEAANWAAARQLAPKTILMGNVNNDFDADEYRGKLNAAFLEALMGKNWSVETWGGWQKMMQRYQKVTANLAEPRMVGFGVWGDPKNYKSFRYAFTSCLLGDGYFSFTDQAVGYSSVPWFDEYDLKIGKSVEAPVTKPWSGGVYRRRFENAMVLVNPGPRAEDVAIESGWKRFRGTQDPSVNDGSRVSSLHLEPKDGIVLIKDR